MLFADVAGFSDIDDSKTLLFLDKFLGGFLRLLKKFSFDPCLYNTWGDCLFAVFDELDDGIKVALEVRDYFVKGDWSELGLMDGVEIRISMHAGSCL